MNVGAGGGRRVRMEAELRCGACGRAVPGGLRAPEAQVRSGEVWAEIGRLRRSYLCGPCRDAVRRGLPPQSPRARS